MNGKNIIIAAAFVAAFASKGIAENAQARADSKKAAVAAAAMSQNTVTRAIANAKPRLGPDPPQKHADSVARQYRQDIRSLLDSKDARVSREIIHELNCMVWGPLDETMEMARLDSVNAIIGMTEYQAGVLVELKEKNAVMADAFKALGTKYGNFRPKGIGMGIGAMLRFYREQGIAIDTTLEKTVKAQQAMGALKAALELAEKSKKPVEEPQLAKDAKAAVDRWNDNIFSALVISGGAGKEKVSRFIDICED